ncbi:MAG: hypothetical protein K9K32_07335, partial [Halanaerobiales bacterium]|nr:hypothetical protein [Halanaerobiales bacterium]
ISDAYQKMAMIYLDTVQPTKADKYLKKALEIREKDNYWEESLLLRLVAENYLNIGNVKKAKEMQRKLEKLDEESNNVILDSRVKIRTGRLREAEEILINELNKENNKESKKVGRAHRETILLLSLISSLEGEKKKALKYAKKGLEKSKNLDSLFTQAVANMRLGHAYQISNLDQYDTAIKHYEKSLEIVDKLNVRRGRAEALWGLTLVYGSLGKKEQMKQYGHEGIKICDKAGDEWLKSLIQLSLGIGFIQLNEYKDALSWLTMAVKSFDYCNDIFGKTVGQIWLTLIDCKLDHKMDFKQRLEEIVPIIVENDLEFIFKKSNLLGSRDNEILIPILTEGFNLDIEHNFCERILKSLNIRPGVNHPGYTLRTKTLGQFKLFRGNNEVKNSEWKRKKAKILFKLFLTFKDRLIPKDRLAEMISPNKNQKSANRDFKVALNALNNVLEPNREARETPYFIIKRDSSYGLNQNVSYDLDFIRFENMIKEGIKLNRKQDIDSAIEYLKKGVEIYNGDFLLNCIYLDWSRETRDKFKNLFIQGTETLAQLYYKKEMYQKTIQIAERLLAEESSIEKAYQIMMKALIKMDQRSQAIKVYNKCVDILKKDLGVIPSQKTIDLYKKVKGK